jgi:hypothetical protein
VSYVGLTLGLYEGSYIGALESLADAVTIVSAWAVTTHAVRVTFDVEPLQGDPFGAGDALNPAVWGVVNTTTGQVLTPIVVAMVDSLTADVTLLEALGDHLEGHTVTATDIAAQADPEVTESSSAAFLGLVQTVDVIDSVRVDFQDRDLRNAPFQVALGTGFAGTLSIGDDGDFETEAGPELIRKLVLRRMNTRRGSLRYLPNYGIGLVEKEQVSSGGLVQLLKEIESQAQQEPDVVRATARGSMDRDGTLIIRLAVQAEGGTTINMRMGSTHGRLSEI